MSRKLTNTEEKESHECFAIYSKNGTMAIQDLGMAIRSLGLNPSNKDLDKIVEEIGNPPGVSYDTFRSLLTKDFPPPDTEEEIREAFGVFDRDGDGTISAAELKHVLMTMGEKLSQEEVDIMIREADIDGNGHIMYEQFVRIMKKTY